MEVTLKDVHYGDIATVCVFFDRPGRRTIEIKIVEDGREPVLKTVDELNAHLAQEGSLFPNLNKEPAP